MSTLIILTAWVAYNMKNNTKAPAMKRVCALPKLFVSVFAVVSAACATADVSVEPEVLEAVATGPARVIIELHLEGGFAPEGDLTADAVRAQRAAIAAVQDAVLSELGEGGVRVTRRHETIPFLALEISAPALARLQAMPDRVARILEDDTASAFTGEQP